VEFRLEWYKAAYPKMKGFRHILQGERDRALMLKPAFRRGIGLLKKFGYTYDILIFPDQLGYTRDFVAAFPDQPFIIDHIAKPYIKDRYITEEWKDAMRAVAAFPNVSCKISGMVTEADWKHWKPEHFKPYLDTVVEAFGPRRIVYGSDWPVCLVAASYEQVFRIVEDYFAAFSTDERAAFFGGNAERFYGL
jgi:L-fuconolactonase